MSVALRVDREGDHATLAPTGPFDLAHVTAVTQAVKNAEAEPEWMLLSRCRPCAARSNRRHGRSLAGTASRSAGRGWAARVGG